MAASLAVTVGASVRGKYLPGTAPGGLSDTISGGNNLPFAIPDVRFGYGNGNVLDSSDRLQVNDWYKAQVAVAATTTVSLDLSGATYTNPFGVALAFTSIRGVIVSVVSPDGVKKVRVGPQNVANAAQLGFGGTGATAYLDCLWWLPLFGPIAGWTITAGTGDLLPLYNPGATSVSVNVWIAGVK